jgi:hypothetical protein
VADNAGRIVFFLDGKNAELSIGASGNEGDIYVRDEVGRVVFQLDGSLAALRLGTTDSEGDVIVRNSSGTETIRLAGGSGDIILSNADCAEDFDVAPAAAVEPGTIMVLGPNGALRSSSVAYDRTVAGAVSGAGECRPGNVLDRRPSNTPRISLALVGKTYCKVDATYSSIEVGEPADDLAHSRARHEGERSTARVRGSDWESPAAAFGGDGPHSDTRRAPIGKPTDGQPQGDDELHGHRHWRWLINSRALLRFHAAARAHRPDGRPAQVSVLGQLCGGHTVCQLVRRRHPNGGTADHSSTPHLV